MMKGQFFPATLGIFLCANAVFAAETKKEAQQALDQAAQSVASPVVEAPAAAAPATAPAKPLTPEEQVRAQLEGTEWTVQLNPSSGSKASAQKDTITFTKKQIKSVFMEKAGYPASNYSLTLGGDGHAVWETMQTKEGEGVAFWRGEVEGAVMRGVLSKHPTEGPAEDYSLNGHAVGEKKISIPGAAQTAASAVQVQPGSKAAAQAQKALPATAPAAAAATQPSAKEPEKKKKRGWF